MIMSILSASWESGPSSAKYDKHNWSIASSNAVSLGQLMLPSIEKVRSKTQEMNFTEFWNKIRVSKISQVKIEIASTLLFT